MSKQEQDTLIGVFETWGDSPDVYFVRGNDGKYYTVGFWEPNQRCEESVDDILEQIRGLFGVPQKGNMRTTQVYEDLGGRC